MAQDERVERAKSHFSDPKRFSAGLEYCSALQRLGFDPDIMCWIYVSAEDRVELAIITSMVDRVGPLPIYELLFAAYNASALPKEIDPFEVSLYSPNTNIGADILNNHLMRSVSDSGIINIGKEKREHHIRNTWFIIGVFEPIFIPGMGVYRVKHTLRNADQDRFVWHTFKKNVEALAA